MTEYNAAQPGENLLDYAMAIAHERELDATGHKHDSDGAVRRFKAAVERALLSLRAEGVQADDDWPARWEAMRHEANEWADMAINGLQWVRNIQDGTSTADKALENLSSNLAHCRATQARAALASAPVANAQSMSGTVCGYTPGMSQVEIQLPRGTKLSGWLELGSKVHLSTEPAASAPVAKPSPASENFAQEVWAAAQSPHGEPMEKSVARVASLLTEFSAPVADNWQQYALPGETTAEQVCERMSAEVTRRTVAAMRTSTETRQTRDELNRLGMVAHTAMNQDARDMRNIMEDLAERLLVLAGGAALASAPVTGEAIAGYMVGTDYFRPDVLAAARIYAENRNLAVRTLRYADAAPQASEAARNAALEEAARQCEDIYSWRGAYSAGIIQESALKVCASAVRALKTQADKDGGDCAKGAGDERAEFEKALLRRVPNAMLHRVDMKGATRLGEYCREEIEACWRLWQDRAALSPAQPTEQGER